MLVCYHNPTVTVTLCNTLYELLSVTVAPVEAKIIAKC